jgi:hypothetical protein
MQSYLARPFLPLQMMIENVNAENQEFESEPQRSMITTKQRGLELRW